MEIAESGGLFGNRVTTPLLSLARASLWEHMTALSDPPRACIGGASAREKGSHGHGAEVHLKCDSIQELYYLNL